MPTPARGISIPEFALLLDATSLTRKIAAVHVHHTWRPRRRDFRGAATIEAMRRYHVETNHWADIAQHLTIDPEGNAWVGRNWNLPPASSPGFNGTAAEGPFMIEMVGDFDIGQDPFDGAQRDAAFGIVARLLRHFGLDESAIRFHRDLHSPKTCPGTGIDYGAFQSAVRAVRADLPAPAAPRAITGRSPFAAEYRSRHAAPVAAGEAPADAEVPENPAAARDIDDLARDAECARQSAARGRPFSVVSLRDAGRSAEWNALKPHVVDLSHGVLSAGGQFRTTPDDLLGIVDAIRSYRAGTDRPHLVLYAHGGLVDEGSALSYAKTVLPWWKEYGVFPVFFVWETGLLEILRQYVVGPRDLADVTTDPMIEAMVRIPGTIAWNGMKESARLASSADAGSGFAGGALQFARELAPVLADGGIHVHAVGHSAGSIFHAFLLPLLRSLNVNIDTLSLLAPAVRADVFKETLLPLVGKGIGRLSCFTMERDAERQDDCFTLYRKSLLYLVSRAFEGSDETPIFGLHECIRNDADLAALFGVNGGAAPAELQLSYAPGRTPNPLTRALRHGDFDNDPATMSAVLRRVLGVTDNTRLGEDDFPFALEPRTLGRLPARVVATSASAAAPAASAPVAAVTSSAPGTRGRALCIGVDNYPQNALAGCVNDARNWGSAFEQLGFDVTYLLDTQATRQAMVEAIARLVASGDPGTPLVLQYAGHGTQMPDDNGDEQDHFDEALVPIDFGEGRFLIDDDLALLLAKLPAGASLTLFMDCCHSGTNSRFAPLIAGRGTQSDRVRYLPPSAELVEAHRRFRARMPAAASRAPEESAPGVIHFAACMDNEFAWESAGHGDFTTASTAMLVAAATRGDANEAFIEAVQKAVQQKGRQHPQMMPPPANMARQRLLSPRIAAV